VRRLGHLFREWTIESWRPMAAPFARPEPWKWNDTNVTLPWLGHSTVLINFFDITILTDPVHHQTFRLSFEPFREPIERFETALNKTPQRIALREIGETFVLPLSCACVKRCRMQCLLAFRRRSSAGRATVS
jgi:hypothetical protein